MATNNGADQNCATLALANEPVNLFSAVEPVHLIAHKWCILMDMGRTNIVIDERLVRKARKLTHLKSKRQIVDKALELLVRSETRKGILRYYKSGIWKGDLKAVRRNRV
jgi:Arc/MetJ family transcription regulator